MKIKDYKVTTHFKFSELTVTSDEELRNKNQQIAYGMYKEEIQTLGEYAEKIREIIGCPMIITSGFRCEELNQKLGGSATSKHRTAQAIDFIPKTMSAYEAFFKICISGIDFHELILEQRGQGRLIHIAIGTKRKKLYSPKQGEYQNV